MLTTNKSCLFHCCFGHMWMVCKNGGGVIVKGKRKKLFYVGESYDRINLNYTSYASQTRGMKGQN